MSRPVVILARRHEPVRDRCSFRPIQRRHQHLASTQPSLQSVSARRCFSIHLVNAARMGTTVFARRQQNRLRSGQAEIWVAREDGSETRMLTTLGEVDALGWSPDGKSIIFARKGDIYM